MRKPSSFEKRERIFALKKPIKGLIVRRSALATAAVFAVLAVLFSLFNLSVFAVEDIDTTGQGIGFSYEVYDSTNGLPTSEANAIVQSKSGMIWIGGYSGLTRYDGNEFYYYPATTGVASVNCLYYDSVGRLWIGTNDSGVVKMKDNEFTFFKKGEGLRSSSVRAIIEDDDGNIIIATTMGLAYIDGVDESLHTIDDARIDKEYICELKRSNAAVYGVTLSGDVFTIQSRKVTSFYTSEQISEDTVNTIYPDPDYEGCVYIGMQSDKVLYGRLDNGFHLIKSMSAQPHSTINDIHFIDNQIWICSDNGIGFFYGDQYIPILDVPMSNSVDKMMIDYEENLWFCSSRQGVLKITTNRFIDIFKLANLSARVVNTTCKKDDLLYIGTDTGLVVLDRNYKPVSNALVKKLDGIRIRCITEDSRGMLWMCTYSDYGLICYNPRSLSYTVFNESNGLASNRVRMAKELDDGTLAVATNAGVSEIKNGKVIARYDNAAGVSNLEILCIEQANDGTIYLASDGDGIYKVTGENSVTKLGLDDGLKSEVVLRLKQSPNDDLCWIVTSNSIAYMKNGKITTINNFPYSNNYDIYFDNDGCLWVLSSNGIYVVKQEDMLADEENFNYTLYDISSGLPSVATVNSYSCIDGDGVLYISSSAGVCGINMSHDDSRETPIRLSVPYVMADDTYIAVEDGETVRIPSSCKRLNIYANAFTYALNNPHLSYYLDGFEKEPIVTTKRNMQYASYTNLLGGTYNFKLNLLDEKTGEVKQTVSVKIVKEKAIYEQSWFLLAMMFLFVLVMAGIIAFYFRKTTAKLLKKQEENRKFINEMTSVFAKCIDMKDAYTNGHSFRVAQYTAMLARKLGKDEEEVERIYNIALLHDIGKISIPDSILNKPGKLDDEEYAVMKSHSRRGNDILKEVTIAPDLALGAGYHHERIDGKGYPSGLKGDEIPEVAQIIAVADTFDAMYSTRPYRKKMELSVVAEEIEKSAGTQLSERVVEAFRELYESGELDDLEKQLTAEKADEQPEGEKTEETVEEAVEEQPEEESTEEQLDEEKNEELPEEEDDEERE